MPFDIIWYWTDILLWALVLAVVIAMGFMRREVQWWSAWQQVFYSRQGMVTAIILLAFFIIGLLDSIHLKFYGETYGNAPVSVLDILLWPVGQQFEETYSAPFALHLFVKKMIAHANGDYILDYPRLLWGGASLMDESQRAANMGSILGFSLLKTTVAWMAITSCMAGFSYWRLRNWRLVWQHLWRDVPNQTPMLTTLITIAIILMLIFSCKDLSAAYHILGTDKIGTDVFYQGVKSIRTGLIIGTVTTLFMLPVALLGGMLARYFRGWTDDIIQYIYSTLNAIPSVLLIAAAALVMQLYIMQHEQWFPSVEQRADAGLLMLCMVLGLTNWTTLCRLLRGETLKLREADYVLAARTLGVPTYKILSRHILPNIVPLVIIVMVLDFSTFVLMEAVLSYVGVRCV